MIPTITNNYTRHVIRGKRKQTTKQSLGLTDQSLKNTHFPIKCKQEETSLYNKKTSFMLSNHFIQESVL